jgi:hypothetical protein
VFELKPLALLDPTFLASRPSQPPLSRRCDDHLNPPVTRGSEIHRVVRCLMF